MAPAPGLLRLRLLTTALVAQAGVALAQPPPPGSEESAEGSAAASPTPQS